jgi:CheY-like chemotaxis protein
MSATLLLADDSVTIQRVIELTFQNEDIRVIATSDGETAIQRIDAEPPDIVLADVGMPKQDGYAVSAHVKRTPVLRKIPVLLLTGAFEPVDEDKAKASGCDGILVKPFEPQQLVGRVRELLAGGAAAKAATLAAAAPARQFAIPTKPHVLMPTPPAAAPAVPPRPSIAASAPTLLIPRQPPVLQPPPPVDPVPTLRAPAPLVVASPAPKPEPPPAPIPIPEPTDMESSFQREFDQLDAAFAKLDPEPAAAALDEETASDFARDLDLYRNTGDGDDEPIDATPRPERSFGDWDLPDKPAPPAAVAAAPPAPRSAARPVDFRGAAPDWPPPPLDDAPTTDAPLPDQPVEPPAPGRVSVAGAFAALLAAEQAQPNTAATTRPVTMSEATVEEVVKRVLSRMTDETVRRIVHDTAEKLIKEEIERIKSQ